MKYFVSFNQADPKSENLATQLRVYYNVEQYFVDQQIEEDDTVIWIDLSQENSLIPQIQHNEGHTQGRCVYIMKGEFQSSVTSEPLGDSDCIFKVGLRLRVGKAMSTIMKELEGPREVEKEH